MKVFIFNLECVREAINEYNIHHDIKYFILLTNICLDYYDTMGKIIKDNINPIEDTLEMKIIYNITSKKINLSSI